MIISHKQGFVFVSNPKAASTSIERALGEYQERPDLDAISRAGLFTSRHMPALELRECLGYDQWETMFTFGVVRHPCDWFVSQLTYNHRRLDRPVPVGRLLTEDDVTGLYTLLRDRRGQSASPSASQWAFLCQSPREPLVDLLIPMEDINTGWAALTERLGIEASPPAQLNRTRHPAWPIWLGPGALEAAASLWAEDFVLYNTARAQNREDPPAA